MLCEVCHQLAEHLGLRDLPPARTKEHRRGALVPLGVLHITGQDRRHLVAVLVVVLRPRKALAQDLCQLLKLLDRRPVLALPAELIRAFAKDRSELLNGCAADLAERNLVGKAPRPFVWQLQRHHELGHRLVLLAALPEVLSDREPGVHMARIHRQDLAQLVALSVEVV